MSITVCRIKGIPIRLHITFFIIVPWLGSQHSSLAGTSALSESLFVLSIFGCVLLHELGHALTARKFGIGTQDITLYPFGGIALLNREAPPFAELFIAIAGPLVNLLIATLLFSFLAQDVDAFNPSGFAERLLGANLFLALFNMIPAFPMDGGRVLHSILQLLHIPWATLITVRLGQLLCLMLGLYALQSNNIILLLIAIIVFHGAKRHYQYHRRG